MNYEFKNAVLPCNEKEDFETKDISLDIICRIYLSKAPDNECENIAKKEDGENYSPDCFFIECVAGKNEPDGDIIYSDWFLGYTKEDGEFIKFGFVNDVPDNAIDFFKKDIKENF